MKIIHQSFWDVADWHPKINWLVENKFRFFHVHCNEIFSEDCRSFIIRFRNKLFSWFIIRSESDIQLVSTIPQHLQLFKAVEFDCSKSGYPIPHNSPHQNQAVEFDCSKSDCSIPHNSLNQAQAVEFDCFKSDCPIPHNSQNRCRPRHVASVLTQVLDRPSFVQRWLFMLWWFAKKSKLSRCDAHFVAKHFRQNMFIALKTINIIWFQSLAVFLIFYWHLLPIALENQWFIWYHNGESFSICRHFCWKLGLYLHVSHRVFQFFALFCHIKDKHREQFLVICRGYI